MSDESVIDLLDVSAPRWVILSSRGTRPAISSFDRKGADRARGASHQRPMIEYLVVGTSRDAEADIMQFGSNAVAALRCAILQRSPGKFEVDVSYHSSLRPRVVSTVDVIPSTVSRPGSDELTKDAQMCSG
nr:hypothetical protein CFP56_73955 [Quercus suber]